MLRPDFAVRRTGERYDRADVDAFVNRVLAATERGTPSGPELTRPELTRADVQNATFGRPFFGPGYAAEQVDDFLSQAVSWLPADEPPHRTAHKTTDHTTHRPEQSDPVQFEPPQFSPVRLRAAYDMDEVDDFVDRVMATVNRRPVDRPVTDRDVREVAFSVVRVREGYEIEQVDLFLDQAEDWLRHP
ncbi:DivIVA domain-containing protein [Kribbella sp. NBC_01245]|uniref:DivIVA domain-containing protein n=1 Tax=Kribbella sp. NBC_01245 TaxID=2903578 RepID=UPI002E29CD28|nr:DivIVA domain-containing protein [Kribbella sp. NBC_01245]